MLFFVQNILLKNILFRVIYKTWATAAVDFFILFLQDHFFTLLTQRRSPLSIAGNLSYLLMINGQICHTTTRVHSSTFKHSFRTAYTSSALYPKSFVLLSGVINGVWGTVWSLQNFLGEFDYSQRIKKTTSVHISGTSNLYFLLIFTFPGTNKQNSLHHTPRPAHLSAIPGVSWKRVFNYITVLNQEHVHCGISTPPHGSSMSL